MFDHSPPFRSEMSVSEVPIGVPPHRWGAGVADGSMGFSLPVSGQRCWRRRTTEGRRPLSPDGRSESRTSVQLRWSVYGFGAFWWLDPLVGKHSMVWLEACWFDTAESLYQKTGSEVQELSCMGNTSDPTWIAAHRQSFVVGKAPPWKLSLLRNPKHPRSLRKHSERAALPRGEHGARVSSEVLEELKTISSSKAQRRSQNFWVSGPRPSMGLE